MTARILVADDDALLREFVVQGLKESGYLVSEAGTISDTLQLARDGAFDLWIFDRQMPGGDAANALRHLRSEGGVTPALLLTAVRDVERRVEGLDAGADDYLVKPFSITELLARVRALLRRRPAIREASLRRGRILLHLDARRVMIDGAELTVTANEWRLLALLAQRPGTVLSRGQIMKEVGVAEDAGEVAVDHLVSRLRLKLREHGLEDVVRTVRGLGFAWRDS